VADAVATKHVEALELRPERCTPNDAGVLHYEGLQIIRTPGSRQALEMPRGH
jgi:hypothetical protein